MIVFKIPQDIIINFVLTGFMLAVGIITAVFTPDWGDLNGDDADAVFASMIAAIVSEMKEILVVTTC